MSMPIPKHIRLELKDSDIEKDAVRILQNMEQLRLESILKRSTGKETEKEYRNLAKELSCEIDTLRHYDARLNKKLEVIVSELNKEKLLLRYDPLQDLFWSKKTPDFLENLNMILFRFLSVDIDTTDKKHHLAQAIKYLIGTEDDEMLSPDIFYGAVDTSALIKDIGLKDTLNEIKITKISNTTVMLDYNKENRIEKAFDEARKLGYLYLRLIVKIKDYLDNKTFYPGYPIRTEPGLHSKEHMILENRIQTIEMAPNIDTATNLHELLKEIKQKKAHAQPVRYSDLINDLVKGMDSHKIMAGLSQKNREFISDLRKKEFANDCITSLSGISHYKKTEEIFLHGNTTYLLLAVSEDEIDNAKLYSILVARDNGSNKIKRILSHPSVYCARLMKFDEDKMAENYEGVR